MQVVITCQSCIVSEILWLTVHTTTSDVEKSFSFNKTVEIQAMCTFQLTCKHIIVNMCYISRDIGVGKISNSKTDLECHSRSLLFLPFIGHVISFLLVFNCNYLWILDHFRDIIHYFRKFKEISWPWKHIPWWVIYFHALVLINITVYIKFEMPS